MYDNSVSQLDLINFLKKFSVTSLNTHTPQVHYEITKLNYFLEHKQISINSKGFK